MGRGTAGRPASRAAGRRALRGTSRARLPAAARRRHPADPAPPPPSSVRRSRRPRPWRRPARSVPPRHHVAVGPPDDVIERRAAPVQPQQLSPHRSHRRRGGVVDIAAGPTSCRRRSRPVRPPMTCRPRCEIVARRRAEPECRSRDAPPRSARRGAAPPTQRVHQRRAPPRSRASRASTAPSMTVASAGSWPWAADGSSHCEMRVAGSRTVEGARPSPRRRDLERPAAAVLDGQAGLLG